MDSFDRFPAPAEIDLRFTIDADAAIGTLEAALQVVRRGGIVLCKLRAGLGSHGLEVWLRLAADEDALQLCQSRLANLIGISAIEEMPGRFAPPPEIPAAALAALA